MAEASSGPTKPATQYLKVPLPPINGAKSPDEHKISYATEMEKASNEAVVPSQPRRAASAPTPAKTPSGALVEAAETLARAIDARIAWHEGELVTLRAARAPFAGSSRHNAADALSAGGENEAEFLARVMRQLKQDGES